MATGLKFYYFGDDEAYFRALQAEFKKSFRLAHTLVHFYESEEAKIQSFFLKIFKDKPEVIFIDVSKETQDYLHLARSIARSPLEHKMITVGLVDLLSPPEIILESMTTGLNLTHVKSTEVFDVVFDVAKLMSPEEPREHGFANANMGERWTAGIPCKVGYIHKDGLHVETNYFVKKGDRLALTHNWIEKKIVPSKQVVVMDVSSTNLFYSYKYGIDLDFAFADNITVPDGATPELIAERKAAREESIKISQGKLTKWVEENQVKSELKKAKMLVVDRNFCFYDNQPRTDKQPFTIRCVPFVNDIKSEIQKLMPQVIVYNIDVGAEGKNTVAALGELTKLLKTDFASLNPFIVVFNTTTPSKTLQDTLGYAQVMAVESEMAVEIVVKMAGIFEKKLSLQPSVAQVSKVYLKKNNIASLAEICIDLKVMKLSETDMIFSCDYELPTGVNLHMSHPVNMHIHVLPLKSQAKSPMFHGLIHSIGESEKKDLRRYVNSVFFRDHDAQLKAETEEFNRLNVEKLKEKTEEEAKAILDKEAEKNKEKEGA